jgi:hypothetical protein
MLCFINWRLLLLLLLLGLLLCCLLHVHPLSAGGGVGGPINHVGICRVLPELQAAAGDADSRADGLLQRFSTQLLKQVPFGVLQAQVTLLPMWDLAVNAVVFRPLTWPSSRQCCTILSPLH